MWESNVLEIGDRAANRMNVGSAQFSSVSLGVANQSSLPLDLRASVIPNAQLAKTALGNLELKPVRTTDHTRIYNHYTGPIEKSELCRISKEGRVTRDGVDITDNDAAMVECFVDYLKKFLKVEVKRGS